jgi:hypothetical protein
LPDRAGVQLSLWRWLLERAPQRLLVDSPCLLAHMPYLPLQLARLPSLVALVSLKDRENGQARFARQQGNLLTRQEVVPYPEMPARIKCGTSQRGKAAATDETQMEHG